MYCIEVLFSVSVVKSRLANFAFDWRNLSFVNSDRFRPLATCLNDLEGALHAWRILVIPSAQICFEIESSRRVTMFAAVFDQVVDGFGVSVVTEVNCCKSWCA